MNTLPDYVVINGAHATQTEVLRTPATSMIFPLSAADRQILAVLEEKYDQEDNCIGLAAPQIGFGKRVIIFAVNDDPALKQWRPDLTDAMPKTLWINPSYQPVGVEKHTDYEACFSVEGIAGPVARYTTITYAAYSKEGQKIEGTAKGFLARVIQHEIDHLNGVLFIDLVPKGETMSIEEYRNAKKQAMQGSPS